MFNFGSKTYIMGILNCTPDSFFDGGKYFTKEDAVIQGKELIAQGADIIDIGGESTRPGSDVVEAEEEISRVVPVIQELKTYGIPISIDTSKASVAEAAIKAGASIINDISGLNFDPNMSSISAKYQAYTVIMHIKGKPKDMQVEPHYENVLEEIKQYFEQSINKALEAGLAKNKIIIDPGIGFGKSLEHNLIILKNLNYFKSLGFPLLLGTSRKSFISKIKETPTENRLEGSIASAVAGIAQGIDILRVHDVKETKRAVLVADAIYRGLNNTKI